MREQTQPCTLQDPEPDASLAWRDLSGLIRADEILAKLFITRSLSSRLETTSILPITNYLIAYF